MHLVSQLVCTALLPAPMLLLPRRAQLDVRMDAEDPFIDPEVRGRFPAESFEGLHDMLTAHACDRCSPSQEMSLLTSRIQQVALGVYDCKAVTLRETLVPGQRLRLTAPPCLVELFLQPEPVPIVVLGLEKGMLTQRGVEVVMEGRPSFRPVVPNIHPEGTADIVIAAQRVCELLEVTEAGLSVSRPARVRWLELDGELGDEPPAPEILARSEALAVRVNDWMSLVRRACRERTPNHLDDVLADLGPMPPPEMPNARCLWVSGMINPLPALGASSAKKIAAMGPAVAPEIRKACLMAESVNARLSTIEMGLAESTRRLTKMVGDDNA